jgi:FkbM family methyltransferase
MTGDHEQRGALTRRIVEEFLPSDARFFLLDVGCSGGLDVRWNVFGERLRAVAFDAWIAEINRLTATDTRPNIRYEAAYVGCRDFARLFPYELKESTEGRNSSPFRRVSAFAADRRLRKSYAQDTTIAGDPMQWTLRRLTLDEYVDPSQYGQVDFIKVDTDGHDIEVVLGADAILAAGGALGLFVEVQLHGPIHEFANTFPNIDGLLRRRGFSLFDLQTYRYSRADLPAPFAWDVAAQTTTGQVLWGDALYLRDLASLRYEEMWPDYQITPDRIMKLACLFDLYGLPDCAAELLNNRGASLTLAQRNELLDLLVSGEPGSYAQHVAAFEADYTSFFRSRMQPPVEEKRADDTVADSVRQLTARNEKLLERLREYKKKIVKLRTRLDDLEARQR